MRRSQYSLAALLAAGLTAVLAVGATAATPPKITPPASIAEAGRIVFCSDITYPPEEFYKSSTPVGSDVDIGTAIAKSMGVSANSRTRPSTASSPLCSPRSATRSSAA